MSTDVHHTECNGLRVTWRRDPTRQQILVVGIDAISDRSAVVTLAPGDHLDLVQARQRWPQLAPLWNAIRHDFWTGALTVWTDSA
ncbi:hypothetical protein [Nocardia sp. N2S4-5]|uniref:hypothetical protein n=1 Tax=Nocardia sp. N2S4-5 TaxID=3351565 RepID=UPI0037D6EE73